MADITFVRVVEAGAGWTTVEASDGEVYTFRGARNWRNNNPGNIEYGKLAKSMGAIGTDGRFAVFPSYSVGQQARERLQFSNANYKDKTISAAIAKYAPPHENDTAAYARRVAAAAGVSVNTKMSELTAAQRARFLAAQEEVEGFKPGRIVGAKGKSVPQSVVQQFKGRALPPAEVAAPTSRQNIATQRTEQAEMRNRVIPPVPSRRPDTVAGKVVKPLPAPKPLSFGKAGSTVLASRSVKTKDIKISLATGMPYKTAPVAGVTKVVPGRVAVKPAVTGLGKTAAQIGQEADNARLSGYRSIQEMGPSSKGAPAKPAAPKKGVIKTTAPEQQPIPRDVVPGTLKAQGYGTGSTLAPAPKAPVAGLIQVKAPTSADAVAQRQAAGALAAQRQAAAQAEQARLAAVQQAQAQAAKVAAQQAAAQRAAAARAAAERAAAARAAALAAARPKITEPGQGGAYRTTSFQQDRFQTTTGSLMPASTNNSRWLTGY